MASIRIRKINRFQQSLSKMAKRTKLVEKPRNSYFTDAKENIQFISTGCAVLDCALGGGLALGRTANVVGDKSTAKTGTATEVMVNFCKQYPEGAVAYRETEAAWDDAYAEAMGLPLDKIDFGDLENPIQTVEDFIRDFTKFVEQQTKAKKPGVYILDSIDALSDEDEMTQDIGKGTYGMAKAKKLSILFRTITRKQEQANVLLLIVSQVRENIGAGIFGEKYKRSGGKALDFYASQVFWLANMGMLKRTIAKVERPYGVKLKATVRKNKVGLPFREAHFSFKFGYGTDDLEASVMWLKEVGRLADIDLKDSEYKEYLKELETLNTEDYNKENTRIARVVKTVWGEIEENFIPKRRKY